MPILEELRLPRGATSRVQRMALVVAMALFAVVGLVVPREQSPTYHAFADTRRLLDVPNALNVLSNAGFALVGLYGLWCVWRQREALRDRSEIWPLLAFFIGVLTTAAGSAWYHLAPVDTRLVWDRLPMTVAFMALLAVQLNERVWPRAGTYLLLPLVLAGIWSVHHWYGTGQFGPYSLVQAFAALGTIMMLAFYPPAYPGDRIYVAALLAYGAAKLFEPEFVDDAMYAAIGISGHTIKHLLATLSPLFIARHVLQRSRIGDAREAGEPLAAEPAA